MLVALVGVCALFAVSRASRADRYRAFGGDLPTLASLPRYVCIPTAWRRR